MTTENYNYTAKVSSVNIEQGTVAISFMPENMNLTPVTLNTYMLPLSYYDIRDANNCLIYQTQDDVPFSVHIENTVRCTAPLQQWKKQHMLQTNINELVAYSNTVVIDANTVSIPSMLQLPPSVPNPE